MSSVIASKHNQMWIGICYISVASLFCILPMVADLVCGFRNGRYWFPCKSFSLNAASIIAISVVMILPMNLNPSTPNREDQVAKLGSMALMSTMVANMLPSLATMDNKRLVVHVIGIAIPIIMVIVSSCMEINTGVIRHVKLAYTQVAILVFLLLSVFSAAIAVPAIKKMLCSSYEAGRQRLLKDQRPEDLFSVEKLREDVTRHCILAETCNPEFFLARSSVSGSAGLFCGIGLVLYLFMAVEVLIYGSGYTWSVFAIVIIQSIGSVVGSISPLCRCHIGAKLDASAWRNSKSLMDFLKVEKYWTEMLEEWLEELKNE